MDFSLPIPVVGRSAYSKPELGRPRLTAQLTAKTTMTMLEAGKMVRARSKRLLSLSVILRGRVAMAYDMKGSGRGDKGTAILSLDVEDARAPTESFKESIQEDWHWITRIDTVARASRAN